MGNKPGKPSRRSSAPSTPSRGKSPSPPPAAPPSAASAPAGVTAQPTSTLPPAAPTRIHPLLESKLSQLDLSTIFTPQEIDGIREHLAALLSQSDDEPITIVKEEFYRFLGATSASLYVNRLYAIFDMTDKGYVNFDDLIRGLAVLSQKASREQKLLLSFHLLDPEGKGYITKQTTTELLRSCLAECRELDIYLSQDQISRIVDNTFDEADLDRNNVVDLQEFQALDVKRPGLFDFLIVDAIGVLNHLEKVRSMAAITE
ncbi:hypothetical protein Poli38472_006366 [Pythium oligandrum]|uniref:EF-hand domain-containing protein n=1 Tax=Pythium oligandrum TaxID=41045 RepID=A0A8K1FBQ0_PYTOL|nr:hypothetical protein Poli38472_006366 [Pythium oligandrum]|eukprot:TMW56356.1 hypothetical protein Poli38472_006366 [Pythium oligandrum]